MRYQFPNGRPLGLAKWQIAALGVVAAAVGIAVAVVALGVLIVVVPIAVIGVLIYRLLSGGKPRRRQRDSQIIDGVYEVIPQRAADPQPRSPRR